MVSLPASSGRRVKSRVEKCFCSLSSLLVSSVRMAVARPEVISLGVSFGRLFVHSVKQSVKC